MLAKIIPFRESCAAHSESTLSGLLIVPVARQRKLLIPIVETVVGVIRVDCRRADRRQTFLGDKSTHVGAPSGVPYRQIMRRREWIDAMEIEALQRAII